MITAETKITVFVEDDQPFDTSLGAFLADNADGIGEDEAREIRFTLASRGIYIGGGGAGVAFAVHAAA